MKVSAPAWSALFPCPVVLVTSVSPEGKPNIITLAWVGTVCSTPKMVGIAVSPQRYSLRLIEESGQFVVNVPTKEMLKAVDLCGMVSGRDVDKFSKTGLTPEAAEKVKPPLIKECPINLECTVRNRLPLGSHTLLVGEIVAAHVDQSILNEKDAIDPAKLSSLVYIQREYWGLDQRIGTHGMSQRE